MRKLLNLKRYYRFLLVIFTLVSTIFAPLWGSPSTSKVNKLVACGSLFTKNVQSLTNSAALPINSALAPLLPLLRSSKADPGRAYEQVSLFNHPSTLSHSQLDLVTKRLRTLERDLLRDRSGQYSKAFAISGKDNIENALREINMTYQNITTELSVTPEIANTAKGAKDLRHIAFGILTGFILTANSNLFTGALSDEDQMYLLGFKNIVALQILAFPGISWIMQNGSLYEKNFSRFFYETENITKNPVQGSVIVNSFNLHLPRSIHNYIVGKESNELSEIEAMILAKQTVGQTYLEKWFDDLKRKPKPKEGKYFSYFDTITYIDPITLEPVLIIAYRGFPQVPEGQLSHQDLDNIDISSRYFPK
jgi:hypothetical protein